MSGRDAEPIEARWLEWVLSGAHGTQIASYSEEPAASEE